MGQNDALEQLQACQQQSLVDEQRIAELEAKLSALDLRDPETANAVADAIVRYHGGGYVPLSARYPWQFQSNTWQAIDRNALLEVLRDETGWDWTGEQDEPEPIIGCDTRVPSSDQMLNEFADRILALSTSPQVLNHDALRLAVQAVLWNASNYPRPAQPHIVGQDITPLVARVVSAVEDLYLPGTDHA